MACSKWEETGLLYSSSELDRSEALSYENHLKLCNECKDEYESYKKEQSNYFTPDILGETPSQKIDLEILRVCSSKNRKQITTLGFLPLFFKKTVYSVSFFVIGFMVVGYFIMVAENPGRSTKTLVVEEKTDSMHLHSSSAVAAGATEQVSDSIQFDSINDTNRYFSKTRGNLEIKGVYPVDLNSK